MEKYECNDCGQLKTKEEFYILKSGKINYCCKQCGSLRTKEWRRRKREGKPTIQEEKIQCKLTRTEKKCTKCGIVKPLTEYFKHSGTLDRYGCECKKCEADRRVIRYQQNVNMRQSEEYTEKKCSECNRLLPITMFGLTPAIKGGRQTKCNDCISAHTKQYYSDPEKRNMRILGLIRDRARKNNIPFNLTIDDITYPEFCPILGIPLLLDGNKDNYPSVDRIIPELGYVKGNIIVISYRANRIKNDATVVELEQIALFYRNLVPR